MKSSPAAPATTLYVAEPPARYLNRRRVVVDSSLICAVLFDEANRHEALSQMSSCLLMAPDLIDHEVCNVALNKRRRGWSPQSLDKALADYADYEVELMPCEQRQQYALACRYDLSAYDAAYLWLAAELRLPLLTFDRKLGDAAIRHLSALE